VTGREARLHKAAAERVVIASNNPGKLKEIAALLEPLRIEFISQSQYHVPHVDEIGATFVENAILKARHASQHTGLAAIADDSGIAVDVLNGAPGIYSARYAGLDASDQQNLEKLLADLAGTPRHERGASFHCVMVYLRHAADPTPIIGHGIWEGLIVDEARGENGFGYDPIFYVPTHKCTSAELAPAVKNQLSHRACALRMLLAQLRP